MAWITTPTHSRDWTNELLVRVEEGYLSWEQIGRAALSYLSEDDVEDMARSNELVEDPDVEDED